MSLFFRRGVGDVYRVVYVINCREQLKLTRIKKPVTSKLILVFFLPHLFIINIMYFKTGE